MRLMLWVGDEGPTDLDLKDGDIWAVRPDTWEPGALELKRWLVIQTEDYLGDQGELVLPEYTTGPAPEAPAVRHARKYKVNYWERLTPQELAAVRDREVSVPIVADRFSLFDIVRK